ncbi:DUF1232 domain-containing protein [Oleiharenicola lentus]|jgi:uncharacterized membrane protein YkvA (DUF1232 family)|nr:YkvA family protein [Oleiharenicola lentus]
MNISLSSPLSRYLADMSRPGHEATTSQHLERGAECVQAEDLAALPRLRTAVEAKLAGIADSPRLRERVGLLLRYLEESPIDPTNVCQREAAFAVFYFLKGYDLIPDSLPDVGLLDDALLVETALRRNAHDLHAHWSARGRSWSESF